jgi:hypothetical protein
MNEAKTQKRIVFRCCKHCLISALMGLMSLLIFMILSALFAGCAGKEYVEVVKTVEVKVPVRCDILLPVLGDYVRVDESDTSDDAQEKRLKNERNIYIYADTLEQTIRECKGGK